MKGSTPKEREEWKRARQRLTGINHRSFTQFSAKRDSGRQLFEKNLQLEEEIVVEEDVVSVDFSQYERTKAEELEEEGLIFSDSD